ncbi:DUF3558 domain-containing protein [Kutzneria kofuensis]|uniref:DUF3558 domain-containing protein n=1 Tax=Kutzneria kofuensis TaxID=103725 RepID=A0A7W9KDL5_9PSEU|nr:DUF3558 domain-containing protein [Kutzneria kofuensis]MBB5890606.1 hypothetical protein [Kutzneria kofuensis]
MKFVLGRAGLFVAAGLAVSLAAACSQQDPGSPSPAPTTSSATSSTSGAPKVASPKNLKGIDPCQLLTAQQLQMLGATPRSQPTRDKSVWGEATCMWENDNVTVGLSPQTTLTKGIEQAYLSKDNYSFFQPTTVDGYPAVLVDKQKLSCGMFVGVSDTQELSLTVVVTGKDNPDYGNPCAFPPKVAGAALKNIPAGQ